MSEIWFAEALLPGGWAKDVLVAIEGGRIAAVTAGLAAPAGAERHRIGLPGLPNLHSHAFQRGMAGLSERRGTGADSFWTWRETMYRFVDAMGPDDVEAIASFCFMEMLEAGFTRVGEFHYLHHGPDGRPYGDVGELAGRIAAAASETGIALTLLPVFYRHGNFGGAAAAPGQRRFLCDPDLFASLHARCATLVAGLADSVLGVAPHSLRAATPDEIRGLPLGAGPVHIHVAEQVREVEDCLAFSGRRPVAFLLDEVPVDERWCLVHATHVTEAETRALAATGAVAGLCPITEASLGDGIFPARDFLDAGGRFGIGSDSNIVVDAAQELRLLESVQRVALRGRNVLADGPGQSTGRALFNRALAGGAQALGAEAAIAPGLSADLVALAADDPDFIGREGDALLDSWIFAGPRPKVDCVWRRGEKVVAAGRHRGREAIGRRYRAALTGILASA